MEYRVVYNSVGIYFDRLRELDGLLERGSGRWFMFSSNWLNRCMYVPRWKAAEYDPIWKNKL